jgi:Tfp pilus assembly protein PilN
VRAVNLIPEDQRAGAAGVAGRSEGGAYAVLALLGGFALLGLLYGLAHRQVASRRGQAASLNQRAQQAQAAAASLAPYTSFIALREEREHAVSQLVDSRFDWAHAFHELGRVLPHTASISTIDGTVGSSTASGSAGAASATVAGKAGATGVAGSSTPPGSVPTVTLTGCATSQAQVAVVLNRLRLIDGVNEATLQSSTKTSASVTGGGAVGQCPPHGPAFTIILTYDPLPSQSALKFAPVVPAVSSGGSR